MRRDGKMSPVCTVWTRMASAPNQLSQTPRRRTSGLAWGSWTEEVRLAMAWNGGVSLAVWMGGVAVELDAARRARETPQNLKDEPPKTTAAARSTAELYAAICSAFDRRLVVDILTGASAGGLNGALLAGAIVHDRKLETTFMRNRWLEIGDFGRLLRPVDEQQPASVMQGEEFLAALKETFKELLKTNGPPAWDAAEPPVVLDVQATNVLGQQHCFVDDWGQPFYASEFRAPIRFRKPADYTADVLAVAARASASFPAAFEPQELLGHVATLAGLGESRRFAIDGGLLENAPIRPAIEQIPRRRASAPVKRYVCYVNAAPTEHEEPEPGAEQPDLMKVMAYTVNLPRDGRVIDQLTALRESSRRAGTTAQTGAKLVALPTEVLLETAAALFPTYQQRRAVLALDELLTRDGAAPGAQAARSVLKQLAGDVADAAAGDPAAGAAELPFIPVSIEPPTPAEGWPWGIRAAQRIIQLELDMLRAALLASAADEDADLFFGARPTLDDAMSELDSRHEELLRDSNVLAAVAGIGSDQRERRKRALERLTNCGRDSGQASRACLERATTAFARAYTRLTGDAVSAACLPSADVLFDADGAVMESAFMKRALAVEVIRRSFVDDFDLDSAANLHVAQLTPLIRSPLFDCGGSAPGERRPGDADPNLGPRSSRDKLAGLRLSHFGGFYRASWRANDFMWGRLDGAAALARVLIDANRARVLTAKWPDPELAPSRQLARALVPVGDEPGDADRRELIWELIRPDEEAPLPEDAATLRRQLETTLDEDLADEKRDGELTWAICARALQYEALREEAPTVVEQVKRDKEAGAFYANLEWSTDGSFKDTIADLRNARDKGALPFRLGCDRPDEASSTLALRTLSHALLVAFAAVGGAVPLSRALAPARMALLAVRGATAPRILDRVAVLVAFTGAAWYLAGRWATIPAAPSSDIPLKAISSPQTLALWVAILGVLGIVVVPAVRAVRTSFWNRRIWQASVAVALVCSAGAIGLGFQWVEHGLGETLTTWNATYSPPVRLLWLVAAVGGFHVASTFDPILKRTRPLLNALGGRISYTSILLGGIGATLAYYSAADALIPKVDTGGWITVVCIAAFATPVVGAIQLGAVGLARLSLKRVRAWAARPAAERLVPQPVTQT